MARPSPYGRRVQRMTLEESGSPEATPSEKRSLRSFQVWSGTNAAARAHTAVAPSALAESRKARRLKCRISDHNTATRFTTMRKPPRRRAVVRRSGRSHRNAPASCLAAGQPTLRVLAFAALLLTHVFARHRRLRGATLSRLTDCRPLLHPCSNLRSNAATSSITTLTTTQRPSLSAGVAP